MTDFPVTGIDVSKYQLEIIWEAALAQGISFAFIRASEGNKQTDAFFHRNMEETARLEIPRGIYHYFKPGKDWKQQRDLFSGLINKYPFELDIVIDVETDDGLSKNDTNNALSKFVRSLNEQMFSNSLMIYTSPGFFDSQLPLTAYAWRLKLWVAHWTKASKPLLPKEWSNHKKSWTFWQHDAKSNGLGSVYGVPAGGSKDICLDRYRGDLAKFKSAYNLHDYPTPPPPQPPPPPTPDPVTAPLFEVLSASQHIFDFPGVNAPIIGNISHGDLVPILDLSGSDEVWIKINEKPDQWVLFSYNGQQLLSRKK